MMPQIVVFGRLMWHYATELHNPRKQNHCCAAQSVPRNQKLQQLPPPPPPDTLEIVKCTNLKNFWGRTLLSVHKYCGRGSGNVDSTLRCS